MQIKQRLLETTFVCLCVYISCLLFLFICQAYLRTSLPTSIPFVYVTSIARHIHHVFSSTQHNLPDKSQVSNSVSTRLQFSNWYSVCQTTRREFCTRCPHLENSFEDDAFLRRNLQVSNLKLENCIYGILISIL